MVLISKSFPQSTRPSLQTRRHSPAPADKSRKARAKTPLTRPSLQIAPHAATLALPPACGKAIALAVLGMRPPIPAPIVAMALNPRALRPRLVLAIVSIVLPLGPLPASPARTLTGRFAAVHLVRDLRTRPERLAAARTPPPLHGPTHSTQGKPERSASSAAGLQTRRQRIHRGAHRGDWPSDAGDNQTG
jgi:hypothetical protein